MSSLSHTSAVDFRQMFEAAPGLFLVLTPDYHIVAASDAYLQATMTRREEIVGRHLFSVFPDNPVDSAATGVSNLAASLHRVVTTLQPDAMAVQKYDVRRPAAKGGGFEERHWSPLNTPVLNGKGELRWIVHKVEDVTDYVRLKQSMQDDSAATAELSARAASMEGEIVKRGQELQFANRELRALHAQLEQRVAERTEELARANAALQREVDARKSTAAVLEKTEAQLLHSQRLEAIGQLAGGIAHDFNNLLTAILGYEMLARDKVGEGSELREELDGIRDAGQRAAELTKQLLTFSRRQVREVHVFELNDVVRRLRPMLQRLVGENIEFRLALTDASTAIEADRSQIEQVLMNLVVNARDAMPDGGTVTLHTDIVELDAAYTSQHLEVEPGEYAMLAVSDTGCGMDRATQERIFEPFFTTKAPGKGTGLGLSTVYGVVKVSRGSIWVYSEPGRGTVFKVYLPRSRRDASRLSESPSKPARAKPGERLLLVEDDPQVRTVAARMLGDAGYEVMPVDTADGALELARQPDVHFDALVTDVVMPRMGGRQLAELVQAIRPRVRVLFMSGYTDDVILQRGVLPSDSAFVPKPLTPASLSRKMRELLDRA